MFVGVLAAAAGWRVLKETVATVVCVLLSVDIIYSDRDFRQIRQAIKDPQGGPTLHLVVIWANCVTITIAIYPKCIQIQRQYIRIT